MPTRKGNCRKKDVEVGVRRGKEEEEELSEKRSENFWGKGGNLELLKPGI